MDSVLFFVLLKFVLEAALLKFTLSTFVSDAVTLTGEGSVVECVSSQAASYCGYNYDDSDNYK